ncbi:unnamed protein product, partial [Ectocarpus sp. 12 AP-2014]
VASAAAAAATALRNPWKAARLGACRGRRRRAGRTRPPAVGTPRPLPRARPLAEGALWRRRLGPRGRRA